MNLEEINNPYVPYTNCRYMVNQYGDIVDTQTNTKLGLIEKDDGLYVELDWIDGVKLYNAAIVVIVAFRSFMLLPPQHYKDIIPLYRNNNNKDITPNNLTYKLPITGILLQHRFLKEFYYIPEYSSYAINKNGQIYNIRRDSLYTPLKIDPSNRMRNTASVNSDSKRNNHPGVYRLLAMTFIDHDSNYESMDVNHINGNKHDDRIENLEWLTHQENMIHAIETGLRSDNKPIDTKGYKTNYIKNFRSISTCAIYYGVGENYLRKSIKLGIMKLSKDPKDWYYIKHKKDKWVNINQFFIKKITNRHSTIDIPIKALNIFTGKIKEYDSLFIAGKELSIDRKSIKQHIEKDSLIPSKGYIFRFKDDIRPFPSFTDDQLYVLKYNIDRERSKNDFKPVWGYSVLDLETNEKKIYTNMSDIENLLNRNRVSIYEKLRNNNSINYNGKYQVDLIRLEGKYDSDIKTWSKIKDNIWGKDCFNPQNNISSKQIKLKNYSNGEIVTLPSIRGASKSLNLTREYLWNSLKIGFMKITENPNEWYYISYDTDDFKDFNDTEIDNISVKANHKDIPIKALNIFTNNLFIFRNMTEASNKTNVARKSMIIQIEKDGKVPCKEYIFRRMDDMRSFPKFTDDQLYVLKRNIEENTDPSKFVLKRGYSVTDVTTNEKRIWTDYKELAEYLKISFEHLYRVLKDHNGSYLFDNRYQVSVINLEGTLE